MITFKSSDIPEDLKKYFVPVSSHEMGSEPIPDCNTHGQAQCKRCFVCSMVAVFRGVRRVLRDDGTLFCNLGDTYLSGNLLGVPWKVAIALQADGWVFRSDMPWVRRSPMPESVTNRPSKALEYMFLFAKKAGYYFDLEAVKTVSRNFRNADLWYNSVEAPHGLVGVGDELVGLDVTSEAYHGQHYASYPRKLIEPLILAGTSAHGACARCGSPWVRVVERQQLTRERPNEYVKRTGAAGTGNKCANTVAGVKTVTVGWRPSCECCGNLVATRKMVPGFGSYHSHNDDGVGYGLAQDGCPNDGVLGNGEYKYKKDVPKMIVEYVSDLPLDDHPIRPCIILDPFLGSGTTAYVALDLGRRCWGIDLSEEYLRDQARHRIGSHPSLRVTDGGPVVSRRVTMGRGT